MNRNKTAIVISDFRPHPVSAALQLYKENPGAALVVSNESLRHSDYGDDSPRALKLMVVGFLKLTKRVEIVSSEQGGVLSPSSLGPMSSLVSDTNDSQASAEKYPARWQELLALARGAQSVADFVASEGFSTVYFFNGRLASSRELGLRFGNSLKIKARVYEWSDHPEAFLLVDYPLHDQEKRGTDLVQFALSTNFEIDGRSALEFIEKKLHNNFSKTTTEVPDRTYGTVIFLGSPHEYMHTSDSGTPNYDSSPLHFIKAVVEHASSRRPIAARFHPNMLNDSSWQDQFNQLSEACAEMDVHAISPSSKWSSHLLVRGSDINAVAGSSICLDAFFLGRTPLFFGPNKYQPLLEEVNRRYTGNMEKKLVAAGVIANYERHTSRDVDATFHVSFSILRMLDKAIKFLLRTPASVRRFHRGAKN